MFLKSMFLSNKDKYQIIYCIFFLLGSFLGGVNKSGNS